MKYKDITNQYTTNNKEYQLKKQKYFIGDDGTKYNVDGKHVIMKPTEREIEVAKLLGQTLGGIVCLIPVVLQPKGIQTPDYLVNEQKFDLKQILGNGKNTLDTAINKKKKQSNNFIFDISKTKMNIDKVLFQIDKIYNSKNREWIDIIVIVKDKEILRIYKRIK